MESFLSAFTKLVEAVIGSSATATLSLVGLLLLLLAGGLAYLAHTQPEPITRLQRVSLLVSLIGGIIFSAVGPGLALFWVSQSPIKRVTTDQAFDNLENNSRADWLVRLIVFNSQTDPQLAVGKLEGLGPAKHKFAFVGNYRELVGYTAKEALQMTGGTFIPGNHISAIIFRLQTPLYPANARGLLQVIRDVESDKELDLKQRFLQDNTAPTPDELKELDSNEIHTYRIERFKDRYPRYCDLVHKFQCAGRFSARDHIGGLNADWHPLGFSKRVADESACDIPVKSYCAFSDWPAARKALGSQFGSRAFLIRNLEIERIPGRIMIDFDEPDRQIIPDIGVR
jgi:hypothetical protein